ncbi:MAG: hypothetical protein WD401_02590 [Thermomicrobiaceae bacterium]
MSWRIGEWAIVVIAGGLVAAAVFGLSAEPLAPLGLIDLSFWLAALVILVTGVLASLILVDLRRAFLTAPGIAVLAALFYSATLISPAATLGHYLNHLRNYALIQSVPVVILTLALIALGVLIGTVINSSVREYDL